MKKLILYRPGEPAAVLWEGDPVDDELGLVQALSDSYVGILPDLDANIACFQTTRKVISSRQATVHDLCSALADGETTFEFVVRYGQPKAVYILL